MKNKLKTVITLFFAVFGGVLILKFITYNTFLQSEYNISGDIYEQAFIAIFVAILLTFANGIRVNWNSEKKN